MSRALLNYFVVLRSTETPVSVTAFFPVSPVAREDVLRYVPTAPSPEARAAGAAGASPRGTLGLYGDNRRFILANTEQLHEKIKSMSERIRSLEDALQQLQSQHSSEPHPLLRSELLAIKRSPELFGVERNGAHQSNGQDHRRDDDDQPGPSSSTSPGVLHDEVGPFHRPRELCN